MCMKPNNTPKICGFRASAADETLKQNAQAQVADDMQVMTVLYLRELET